MAGGHRSERLSGNRRMVAAASSVNRESPTIHLITEADVTAVRSAFAAHRERSGEHLSLTAYVAACLARTMAEYPGFNAFRRGGRLVTLEELTISVLAEREFDHERVPEPVSIREADQAGFRGINDAVREAGRARPARLGEATGTAWVRFIPGFLLRSFVKLASRSTSMQERFGVAAVTAVGMFGRGPLWMIPLTNATVTVAVGGIVQRPVLTGGSPELHEHLCLTVSFDHDVVDGAPAARFTSRLTEILESGDEARKVVET